MRIERLVVIILLLFSAEAAGQAEEKLDYWKFKFQPQAIFFHNMYYLGTEYAWNKNESVFLELDYSSHQPSHSRQAIGVSGWLNEKSDERFRVTLSYRWYFDWLPSLDKWSRERNLVKWDQPLFISAYLRYRHWLGSVTDENTSGSIYELPLASNGMAIGGMLGYHLYRFRLFSVDLFLGGGYYFLHQTRPADAEELLISEIGKSGWDIRLGLLLSIGQ